MRGKRAKHLRRLTETILSNMGTEWSDGYNQYNQAMNRIDWVPQLDDQGLPLMDPEGYAMMRPDKAPGTITTAWKFRATYQTLKKQWKSRHKRDGFQTS